MTWFRTVWLICLLFGASTALLAQKPAELKKNGEKFYANARWREAQQMLSQYQEQKPGDPGILTKLGVVYYHLHQPDQARKFLEYVLSKNPESADPDLYYYLAATLHGQSEFERAIPVYKSFLRVCGDHHPLRAGIADQIRRCVSGQQIGQNDAVALVEGLGDRVNTPGDEFAPLPSVNHADRLYYAAARPDCTGGRRNDDGYEDTLSGHWCSDMFVSTLKTSGWENDGDMGSLLNTSRHEVALGFNATGKVLFFFRGFTLFSGEMLVDTAGSKDEYAVAQPLFKGPLKTEEGDTDPCFLNDTTLMFASRRPGGFGGLDLYVSVWSGGMWTEPKNLGPQINSPYDERSPFLAHDGRTLYFSSNHTGSMGGLDIYKSIFEDAKQMWQTPVNLGAGINSPADDAYFRLAADGRTAYFSSDRLASIGQRDIFIAYFRDEQPEQTHTSVPALFTEAGKNAAPRKESVDQQQLSIPVLLYDNDRDLVSDESRKVYDKVSALARTYPEANVLVTVHTDESGPAKFDLYNGIKRGEIVGKALVEKGVSAGKIAIRSCGSAYPVARNVLDAVPNPAGQHLNRRVEIGIVWADNQAPATITMERPQVSALMAADGGQKLDAATRGLSYKIEVATTRQILNNDVLFMYSDLMIESQPGSGAYRYTSGWVRQYQDALRLKQELQHQDFSDALIVAYINGVRISKAEAVGLLQKYPDLVAYVKG